MFHTGPPVDIHRPLVEALGILAPVTALTEVPPDGKPSMEACSFVRSSVRRFFLILTQNLVP